MLVRTLKSNDIEELYAFNSRIYPEKSVDPKAYINFWLSKSDNEKDIIFVIVDENDHIHGQMLASSMNFYYNNTLTSSRWGFDLIVEESLRKENWGIDIFLKDRENPNPSCGTGATKNAMKMAIKSGAKLICFLKKYVGIVNPLSIFSSVFRGKVSITHFPSKVSVSDKSFTIVDKNSLMDKNEAYNLHLWEPSRDKKFLTWRYFSSLHDYAFYKDQKSDDFFVLRTITISHITLMLLVDWRCDATTTDSFECIYQAVKIIMKKLRLAFIAVGSSLDVFDVVLERHHLRAIGEPRPVTCRLNVKDKKSDIEKRNFAFVTFADSDGETNWL